MKSINMVAVPLYYDHVLVTLCTPKRIGQQETSLQPLDQVHTRTPLQIYTFIQIHDFSLTRALFAVSAKYHYEDVLAAFIVLTFGVNL